LVNFTKIDELTDVTEAEKQEIKSNLVKDLVTFNKHEKAAESQRFKKRWVQSTEISDKIGKNARLSETITSSVNITRNTFKGKEKETRLARQVSNSLTVDDFLEDIRVSCEKGVNAFSGGLIGANIICRRFDGVCNNLKNKHFGATGIPMKRLATPAYSDGKFERILV
jgi:hypothetical protein